MRYTKILSHYTSFQSLAEESQVCLFFEQKISHMLVQLLDHRFSKTKKLIKNFMLSPWVIIGIRLWEVRRPKASWLFLLDSFPSSRLMVRQEQKKQCSLAALPLLLALLLSFICRQNFGFHGMDSAFHININKYVPQARLLDMLIFHIQT